MSLQNLLTDAQKGATATPTVSGSSSKGLGKLLSDAQQAPSVSSQPQPVSSPSPTFNSPAPSMTPMNFGMQTSTPATGSAPNVVNSIFQGAAQGFMQPTPQAKFSNAYDGGAIQAGGKAVSDSLTDTQNRLANAFNTFGIGGTPQGTVAQKVGAVADVGLGIVNNIFSPISGVIATFASIPGTNIIANGINKVFGAIGGGASAGAQEAVNELPISQATKDAIQKPVGELAALAAMILAGKAGETAIADMKSRVVEVTDKIKADPQVAAPAFPEAPKKSLTKSKAVEPTAEPYTPDSMLPTIDFGSKAKVKDTLPTIQMDAPAPRAAKGDLTYEPINYGSTEPRFSPTEEKPLFTSVKNPIKTEAPGVPEAMNSPIEVKGTGETKVRGLAAGVEAKAIENKLVSNLGDLPEYKSVSMKDQAIKAADIMTKDPGLAKAIAMGEKSAPDGVLPESVFVAVEDAAIKNGDVATLRDLASGSKLTSEATTMGQRIRTLAERDPDSPVKAIGDLVKSRREVAEKRTGNFEKAKKQVSEGVKSEIAKNKPTKETWSDFVTSLQC